MAAILRTPSLRSPSSIFLCSLAVSDFLVGLVVQPAYIANELIANEPGSSLSHAGSLLSLSVCGVSLCAMTAISVDRFLAIHYHMRYPNMVTEKRALYASATLWVISVILSCLSFGNENSFFLVMAVGTAICLFISTFSDIRIYHIVRRHQLQIQAQQQSVQSLDGDHYQNMVQSKKSAIKTFIYYICMTLCYSPAFIMSLTAAIFPETSSALAWILTPTVTFMNSSINPFLYYWRTNELRMAILKTIRSVLFKQTEGN